MERAAGGRRAEASTYGRRRKAAAGIPEDEGRSAGRCGNKFSKVSIGHSGIGFEV